MIKNVYIRIGSRGSSLALAQAYEARKELMTYYRLPEERFPIKVIVTTGDQFKKKTITQSYGKASFTKELEEALLNNEIDIAIHSSKDLATIQPAEICLAAFLKREDPRDAFIGKTSPYIEKLPEGSCIGSSSLRRYALIKKIRPDIRVIPFSGNVETRLKKLKKGNIDGIILALAGLKRLGLSNHATQIFNQEIFPPAPGQGAICIECRKKDTHILEMMKKINHIPTEKAVLCERSFLRTLEGSCRTPIAGYAEIKENQLFFSGVFIARNGNTYKANESGYTENAEKIGALAAQKIKKEAGDVLLSEIFAKE